MKTEDILMQVAKEVAACQKCALHFSRKNAVPGEGPVNSEIMFIGEGPGFHENEQGRTFAGAAGKYLEELLGSINITRKQVFIKETEGEPELTPQPIPTEGDPPWMVVARKYLGVSEVAGTAANPKIINFFLATSFWPTRGDEDPWCSAFACVVMEEAGYRSTRNAAAISWQDWGKEIEPRLGAVVVFAHHVGFFDSLPDDGRIKLLGGNQSNSVNISSYNPADVLAYRWPA